MINLCCYYNMCEANTTSLLLYTDYQNDRFGYQPTMTSLERLMLEMDALLLIDEQSSHIDYVVTRKI